MSKQMIVNAAASEEIRVAIVENNRLVDLDIETQSRTKQKGNIYKGIVANVEDSLEAAFIEFGEEKQGFLPLAEVRPSLYPEHLKGQRKPRISDVLTRGQEIVVQVTKDEMGQKGAAVTSYLSLPGRYVVLMHSDDGGGAISRKIEDEQARRRARDLLSRLEVPQGMAVIIRTAGMNRSRVDLYRDLRALCRAWETIDRGAQLGRAPTLVYREPDLVIRTIRDYFSPDIKKIVIDSEEEFDDAKSYLDERMPDALNILELHRGRQPVFEAHGIERAIDELFVREVKLPSGGSIVIDQAEALVAIDVNSGRSTRETDHEATVYKTNLEAAAEVARQLRLRDLGGIIVVDFIDMVSNRHERDVERAIRDAMRADKAKVKIGRISENGTLEITRQRLRQAHRLISFAPCQHCDGTGAVRDPEGLAVAALRQTQTRLAKATRDLARVIVRLPVTVANVLSNAKRSELTALGEEHQLSLEIIADPRLQGAELKFEEEARGRAGLDAAHGVKDPRLDADRGRRRRRGREQEPMALIPSQPPPSIGPVPQFLVDEETLLSEDELIGDEAPDETAAPIAVAAKADVVENFDDPLEDALFGSPPVVDVNGLFAAPPIEVPREENGAGGKKKRRRRRRSRRRDRPDGVDENGVALSADGESADGDDDSDDNASHAVSDSDGQVAARANGRAETGADADNTQAENDETDDDETPAAKPRGRRRRRPVVARAASPDDDADTDGGGDTTTEGDAVDDDVEASPEAKAPKRAPRRRRTPAAAATEKSAAASDGDESAVDGDDDDAAAAPKPRRRRPRGGRAGPQVESPAE